MKKVVLMGAVAALGATSSAYAQFVDNCADATTPQGVGTYTFDLTAATNDAVGVCGASDFSPDAWLQFIPASGGLAVISTCGLASFDTVLSAYDGCGGGVLDCVDDACGLQSEIQLTVSANVPVWVRIAGFNGATGAGSVSIDMPSLPPDGFGLALPDRAPQDTDVLFTVAVSPGQNPDSTNLAVVADLAIIGGSGTQQFFDDGSHGDQFPQDGTFSYSHHIPAAQAPGTYTIGFTVTDAQGRSDADSIIFDVVGPAPAEDDCATPHNMGEGTFAFDTNSATNDGSVFGTCGGSDTAPDVWVRYTPSANGLSTFSLCGSAYDTVINLWSDCPGTGGAMLACNDDSCGLQSSTSTIVTAGTPVWVRLTGFFGNFGTGTLTITNSPIGSGGPADDCAAATAVGDGTYLYDTASATNDGTVVGTCGASDAAPDLWIRYHPTGSGNATVSLCGSGFDSVVNVWSGCPSSGGTLIACNDDFCGLQSQVAFGVTAGTDVYIRLAGFAGGSGSGTATITGPQPPPPGSWFESGDAGGTPLDAQSPSGSGPLNAIFGNIPASGDADMYRVNICSPSSFSATTVNGDTAGDTQLFVFDANGIGVVMDDDDPTGAGGLRSRLSAAFITTPGTYYLAVSRYDNDPVDEGGSEIWADTPFGLERAPDGPGAPNPVGGWIGASGTGSYRLDLTGTCFPGGAPPCDPDYNQDGNADQDDVAYIVNVIAGGPNPTGRDPDFNQDGNVDQDDYAALVNVIAGAPCP